MTAAGSDQVFTVYQLNKSARTLVEAHFQLIWVKGELSNVALPRSGHVYFTLKDEHAQIRCAMFKGNQRRANFIPEDGMSVLIRASVSIYEERGDYQLIVTHIEQWGLGQLQQAFEALKTKLQQEGLFLASHKKTLPRFPRHIGLITSATGAAIQDILSVLKRRYPIAPITLFATLVQGKTAAPAVVKAIQLANQQVHIEVLIIARGGGSLEDLWGFNEEMVARAIHASIIPIVTGIGHEVDFTIADFVADVRAPTPSVAAETITPDAKDLLTYFQHKENVLIQAMKRQLHHYGQKLDNLEKLLIHPGRYLAQAFKHCDYLQQKIFLLTKNYLQRDQNKLALLRLKLKSRSPHQQILSRIAWLQAQSGQLSLLMKQQLQIKQQLLGQVSASLHSVSPLATLSRGYAIVTSTENNLIRDGQQLKIGQFVNIQLAQGSFTSRIEGINFKLDP